MIKKNLLLGVLIGFIANAVGLFIAAMLLGKGDGLFNILATAKTEGVLGKLISLGAVVNLIAFFIFIKKKQDYKARGVLLATVLVAIITVLVKFL